MPNAITKPWWKSTAMLAAYTGLVIALVDALSTMILGGELSWRTAVIGIGSALAAWGRKNAKTVISSWLGLDDPNPEDR